MRKKLVMLLTLALTVAFVGGCGKDSQKEVSNGVVNSDTKQESPNKESSKGKAETLSEYLSTEKTIAYVVSEMDKAETPKNIYFFENGKLTIIPGEEFEMTLGDFAQMEDKDIWEKYETVKKAYTEKYVEVQKNRIEDLVDTYCINNCGTSKQTIDNITQVKNNDYSVVNTGGNSGISITSELEEYLYVNDLLENYTSDELVNAISGTTYSAEIVDNALVYYQNKYDSVKDELDEYRSKYTFAGPFFDMPFSFVIETDSTGNNMQKEYLAYPTLYDDVNRVPTSYTDTIDFANVDGHDVQIYDSTYNCHGLGAGEAIFCSRASMKLDTVDSKNVLIDLKEKELEELFKDDVTARYGDSYKERLEIQSSGD